MEWSKVCAIKGPAGEQELAELIKFAVDGWIIAFMDSCKEKGEKICSELQEEHNVDVFFYHGRWDEEEDVDIFWGFVEAKYGGANHIINAVT
jgi:hypothetical protein